MKQVILLIHGVGMQTAGYSDGFQKYLKSYMKKLAPTDAAQMDASCIYKEILWSPVTQQHQDELWNLVQDGDGTSDLDMVKLRTGMINFAGDAIAYQNDCIGKPIYDGIHQTISDALEEVAALLDGAAYELTIVAHSLGTVIASNYLYDHHQQMTAVNFFTLGSPLAIWLLRYGSVRNADKAVRVHPDHGTWINILDDEDVVAYPLRPLSPAYRDAVTMDYITEIGGFLSAGSPLSHMGYWTDGNVFKPIAKKLVMDYQRIHNGVGYEWATYQAFIKSLWNI